MARLTYIAEHPTTRVQKKAYEGWSWTAFFFGFWVSATRGQTKWALLGIPGQWLLGFFTMGLGSMVQMVWMGCKYNEWHRNWLTSQGYKVMTTSVVEAEVAALVTA